MGSSSCSVHGSLDEVCAFCLQANLEGKSLDLYKYTWENVLKGIPAELKPQFVYMWSDVTTIVARMQERGRDEEKAIPTEYLETLKKNHDEWLGENIENQGIDKMNIAACKSREEVWTDACTRLNTYVANHGCDFRNERNNDRSSAHRNCELTAMMAASFQAGLALAEELDTPAKRQKHVEEIDA